ncbi:hypothetical protein SAY86_014657 [Trapa natans]|uniref:NAB domain-containing protein n=1 Tax=Trapa natans TaxID=22666 RepID=A0AAN7QG43_TRANT|nr:hypothetical protein SAY86_014657 [Trapa natans]
MSLVLLHRQCSREINVAEPLLSPETTSEISNDSETEEKPGKQPSNQACHPSTLPTRGGSVVNAAATPSWLSSALSDIHEKMEQMAISNPEKDDTGESFAQRADTYYQKRPQLLAFLQDLYRAYISLSDRYVQLLSKNNHTNHSRHSSLVSSITADDFSLVGNDHCHSNREDLSDAESLLSSQQSSQSNCSTCEQVDYDVLVAEIVIKNVECDILLHEVEISSRRCNDASRKIELQKSLLEVLESERLILVTENARLGYRVGALIEENRGLVVESASVKRKADELARCLLKMREDQRACQLSRRIEDLQEQIYRLEKRNKEYYRQLVRRDLEVEHREEAKKGKIRGGRREVEVAGAVAVEKEAFFGLWGKVKRLDFFMCGMKQTDHSSE